MSKQNTWNIDLTKQVNIIIGKEYGKTTLLKKLYSEASFSCEWPTLIHDNGSYGVGFVPCDTSTYIDMSESQSRLKFMYDLLDKMSRFNNPKLLIIDNIERGLHIDTQRTLISDLLSKGGPNLKIICSTHSPTIFYQGWIDCVIRANE